MESDFPCQGLGQAFISRNFWIKILHLPGLYGRIRSIEIRKRKFWDRRCTLWQENVKFVVNQRCLETLFLSLTVVGIGLFLQMFVVYVQL